MNTPTRMFFVISNQVYRIRISSDIVNHQSNMVNVLFFPAFDGKIILDDLSSARIDVFHEKQVNEWSRTYSICFNNLRIKKQGIVEESTTVLKVVFNFDSVFYKDYDDVLKISLIGRKDEIRPQLLPSHLLYHLY